MWNSDTEEHDGVFHVWPDNDLIVHDVESEDCVCGPAFQPVPRADGSVGWLVIHHSLDGREQFE